MQERKIQKVVIAGGGTSGWIAAAALSKLIGKNLEICLIESDEIGRIGVGEATIPTLRTFHKLLGIDEQDLMRSVQATFKLGIEFINWGEKEDNYFHSFGMNGKDCWACDFQHFWLSGKKRNMAGEFSEYNVEQQVAKARKIAVSEKSNLQYAYHLDAGLYAEYLKKFSFKHGVKYIEGKIKHVHIAPDTGYIESLELENTEKITGDLFLDCTGFGARLIEGALNTRYEPYGEFLPCDSALAIQTEKVPDPRPYTQAIAHDYGWQWRIPLQHRVGNGLVYSGRYASDEQATDLLMSQLESPAVTDLRSFKYNTGRRLKAWNKNCIAVGLSAGFLEPVESTSIHLAMSSVLRLLRLFPGSEGINDANVNEFNQQAKEEMEVVRDFIVLHYHATERADSPFWRYCKDMKVPDTLAHRMELFKRSGSVPLNPSELFKIDSWTQVLFGQRIMPTDHHPIVDEMRDEEL
ncbi:MAG: tryptophan halogenase, partial [Alteromonadaceae bacterium]